MSTAVESKMLVDSGCDQTLVARRLADQVPGLDLSSVPRKSVLVKSWTGRWDEHDVQEVDVMIGIPHPSPDVRPVMVKVKAFVADMVDEDGVDIILAHQVEQSVHLREYLATERPGFPSELSPEPSPEELQEDEIGTEAFFRSSSDASAPEYTVAADFPLLDQLKALLTKYDKVFKPSSQPMDCEPMKVELIEGAQLRKQPLRHFPPNIQAELETEVERLLREGIIQPSKSAMVSAPVAARKSDGALRMCIDLKYLNSLTVSEGYPMPRVDESMRSLGGRKYYCKLDLRWGFNQMELHADSRHLTAFAVRSGLYEFTRVPFGLMNASGYYHYRVSSIVRPLTYVVPFLDDMAFGADTPEEFLTRLEELLKRLASRRVVLKPSKCVFGAG